MRQFLKRYLIQPGKRLFRPIMRLLRELFLSPAIKQFHDIHERLEVQLREMNDTVKMTDRALLGMGLLQTLPARGSNRLPAFPEILYVDMRCLQDPFYSHRGIGFHASGVLRHAKKYLGNAIRIVGLIDSQLPPLPEEYDSLVDETTQTLMPDHRPAIALHLSPMTHDGSWLMPMLVRPEIFQCALFYDAIPLEEPDRYLATPLAHRTYVNNLVWLRMMDVHCPISKVAADQLRNLIGSSADRTCITGACLRKAFTGMDRSVPLVCPFEEKRYFLVVGGGDKRKNVETVLQAHAALKSKAGLVIGGHYEDDHVARLKEFHSQSGGTADRLFFAKGSSDIQLAVLYGKALATVVPSRSEGFSLPVAEALACDCPVIVSDIPAHRELTDFQEAFFDPSDAATLTKMFQKFIDEPATRGQWLSQQKREEASFAEQDVASRVWSHVLRFLPPQTAKAPAVGKSSGSSSKPRLAFLTPLPPERTGVADYSEQCLKALAKYADVDVFTNRADCRRDPAIHKYELICEYPYLSKEYDRVVSVIANSTEYNRLCVTLLNRFGGPCISHDARLIDYYMATLGMKGFAKELTAWLKRPVTPQEGWDWYIDQSNLPTLCFEEVLPKADPFIVHSKGIQSAIEKQYGIRPEVVPFAPYRQFEASELTEAAKQEARKRLGWSKDVISIVSLGIVAKTKAPEQSLDALRLLRKSGIDAEMHFVGVDGGVVEFWDEWLTERGLHGKAHFVNHWIDEQTYRDYVIAADVALQLRTHRFGGISGALADCIGVAVPTVANVDLAEALDAPDFVLRTGDELEPNEIAQRLEEAIESRSQRPLASREEYLKVRNFDAYARELLKVLKLG